MTESLYLYIVVSAEKEYQIYEKDLDKLKTMLFKVKPDS